MQESRSLMPFLSNDDTTSRLYDEFIANKLLNKLRRHSFLLFVLHCNSLIYKIDKDLNLVREIKNRKCEF